MLAIQKASVNYFYAAFNKSTTLTKNFSGMLYPFDFKYLLGGLSELKILVSVVRFRPGPPRTLRYVLITSFTVRTEHMVYTFHCAEPRSNNISCLLAP